MSNLPNFLIAGAAKCGTSSLHNYLAQHPEIFMSKVKEPRFFSSYGQPSLGGPKDDEVEAWYVKDYEKYKALFDNVNGEKMIGESSADTLYFHENTIPLIKERLGDPKIVIILRDPVKRLFSAYQHMRRDERESLELKDALKEEDKRIAENWELIYHYTTASKYSEPLEAFMNNFSTLKVVINEELLSDPQKVLKEVFEFLEVDPNQDIETGIKYNQSGIPKFKFIHNLLFKGDGIRKYISPIARTFMNHEQRKKLSHKIQGANLSKLTMDPALKPELNKIFQSDVAKLESLINKDLSNWWLKN